MPVITISELRKRTKKTLTPTILIEHLWPKLEEADPAIWIHRILKNLSLKERELEGECK